MRSRYSAYAVGDSDYVWRTWHPRTRPDSVELDPELVWTGLTISGSGDHWVDFVAEYLTRDGAGEMTELSRFEMRAGRWFYVDGDLS